VNGWIRVRKQVCAKVPDAYLAHTDYIMVELRSDTFTLPGPAMLEAMMSARPGDDVFGEDASTNELQSYCAGLFGYESALFCTSGTMANQIAIACHTRPGDEIICDALSHIYLYEGGGIAANSGVSVQLLNGHLGRITAGQAAAVIKADNPHFPNTRMISLENTVNKGGGSCYHPDEIQKLQQLCRERGLIFHLDGARLFNAMLATGTRPPDYGSRFDSISICLSKGLGAPMGSVLMGSREFIHQAMRVRKRWGGGWRQSAYMAAAGLFALKNQVLRLSEDHRRAQQLAEILKRREEVEKILPVETNIVIFYLRSSWGSSGKWVARAAEKGILCAPFGDDAVRLVTHLDFSDQHLDFFSQKIKEI
jgi:threonine aldolase